jgi:hypothetical protein
MARIHIADYLPFVSVVVHANGMKLPLQRVLLDTGAARTTFRTRDLEKLGITTGGEDKIRYMTGIGGREGVVEKEIGAVEIDDLILTPFTIYLAALKYDIPMNGILGLDFLLQTGAVIDLNALEIRKG